jgi:exodeoxyribonuclease V alpha subunit
LPRIAPIVRTCLYLHCMDSVREHIEGILERITYANEENGWSVVRIVVAGRIEPVTAVGNLLGVQPGESIRLHGCWTVDRRFGEQFRVDSFVTVQPATLMGIEKYLGSGLVPGIGKVMAGRLVKQFGLETLDVIESHPKRLIEVDGVGPIRRERIEKAWREQREIKEVMLFLQSHSVSTAHAIRIYKTYGNSSISIVKDDPYRLALDVFGIGFKTADRIARSLGIAPDAPERARAGILHVLFEFSGEGHVFVPQERLIRAAVSVLEIQAEMVLRDAIVELSRQSRIVIEPLYTEWNPPDGTGVTSGPGDRSDGENSAVYLRSLHAAEVGCAASLRALARGTPHRISIDIDKALAWFEEDARISLADEQRKAIRSAVERKVLVVTGGPGTGKTTLVNGIIRILEKKGLRVRLAAPTGRAAKRMAEATGREAKTIHRLLEFSPRTMSFGRNGETPLEADLVIIDEFSMVDVILAQSLLTSIPPACRLVLVGDVDQLPSVGPGSILRDTIDSGVIEVVRLQTIFRQAERSRIIVNAHRINRGEMPLIGAQESGTDSEHDYYWIERKEPEQILETIRELAIRRIPRRFGLHPIDDIQILTPMHRGALGATSLNTALQSALNPQGAEITRGSRTYRVGDKVIQLRNNYDLDVYNGDIGRLLAIDEVDRVVRVRFDDRIVTYDQADLDELMLAYACSIHKAQGSEFPCVIVPIHTQHYVMLQRNLLYTAITRGKRLVVLVGTKRALSIAVRNARPQARCTRLAERLSSEILWN